MCSRPTEMRIMSGRHPGRHQLRRTELPVRGAGRVDDEAAHISDVREVTEEVHRVDEHLPRRATAHGAEGEDGAGTRWQVARGSLVVGVIGKPRVVDPCDSWVLVQPLRNRPGIGDVLSHALRQGLHPLQQQERRHRAQRGTDIAQLLRADASEEPVLPEVPPPGQPPIRGHRLSHEGETTIAPIEGARFDDHPTEGRAMSAKELRRGMHDDIGAVLDRPAQHRRSGCRIDHQGHTGGVCDVGESGDVRNAAGWIGDRLGEDDLRAFGDRGGEVVRIIAVEEGRLDPEAAQCDIKLRHGAPVEGGRRNHMVAGSGQRGEGKELRRHAAARGDRSDTSLEARHSLLECGDGRIGDSRVDVTVLLQCEQRPGIGGVLEDKCRRLVDRHRA